MKTLKQLYKCNYEIEVNGIKTNSKKVQHGDLFVCIKGLTNDGHNFIQEAISNGAVAIVSEKDINCSVPVIKVKNTKTELRSLLNRFYGNPNDRFKFIGVTGTSGKTTTSIIIYEILKNIKNSAYIGSAGVLSNKFNLNEVVNTTPDICELYNWLENLSDNEYIAIETSSVGLKQNRMGTIKFDIGIYTNISFNHLNIHGTFEDYKKSKQILFDNIKKTGYAILNIDDHYFNDFLSHCHCHIITYGKSKEANIRIVDINLKLKNTMFTIIYKNQKYKITTNLIGEFNVYNICAALATALCIGIPIEKSIEFVKKIRISAKVERLNYGQEFTLIFDTCHTKNAVQNLLYNLNLLKKNKIIVVASMDPSHLNDVDDFRKSTELIVNLSDYTIFTFDISVRNNISFSNYSNKLGKNLNKKKYEICLNNVEAIKKAIKMASSIDIVLVTGYSYFYGMNKKDNIDPYLICRKAIEERLNTLNKSI